MSLSQDFISFAIEANVLRFGEFTTKAGRLSPYFFNAGDFYDGQKLSQLARFYAQTAVKVPLEFDVLYGPAYKGIPLVVAMTLALLEFGVNKPFAFNRKEAKDHGEGGLLVGAPLQGQRVLIVDDVISAGTSIRESFELIAKAGGTPVGCIIALDRQEQSGDSSDGVIRSAVQAVEHTYNIPVFAVATLTDLLAFMMKPSNPATGGHPYWEKYRDAIAQYRETYGVKSIA